MSNKTIEKMRLQEAEGLIGEMLEESPVSCDKLESLKNIVKLLANDSETYRLGFVEQLALVKQEQDKNIVLIDRVNELLSTIDTLHKAMDDLRGMK